MNDQQLLKRLLLIKANPKLAETLPQGEILKYISELLGAFNALKSAIETNKIKGQDGYTPKEGKDYYSKAQTEEMLYSVLEKELASYESKAGSLLSKLEERVSTIKDGKDAEITEDLKEEIASLCLSLIELPDFDTLVSTTITSNPEATRDSLELLNGEERYKVLIEDVEGLQAILDSLAAIRSASVSGGISKNAVIDLINQYAGGSGVPDGGTTGQVLTKLSNTDGDADWQDPAGGSGAVDSVNGQTGVVVLDADDIDDTSTTNKFATATQLAKVDNISITQPVDLDALETASHAAVTLAGTPDYITLAGQVLTQNQIDLTTDVTGDLPFANLATLSAHQVLGRAGAGTGDVAGITMGNDTILGRSGSGDIDDLSATQVRAILNVADGATAYTNENAQDAVGTILTDTTSIDLIYDDAGNTISAQREALTGDITAPKNSNATTLATVNSNVGSFGLASSVAQFTVNAKGLITAAANVAISITASAVTDFAATVRATVLTGISFATSTAVTAADTVLVAIGKLQAQNTAQDTAIALNTAKVTNATHTGEVTGATALTVDKTAITNKTLVTAAVGDQILIADASDTDNLKRVTVQTIVDLAGGGGNTFNDIYIDQSGGTSDTYGVLGGTINGSNALFTVSEAVYATGTLKVWLNGQLMTQGSSEDFVETTPASGTFTFNTAPVTGSLITVEYQKVVTNSDTIVTTSTINELVDDRVATLLVAGTNITLTYNDGANTLTIDATGGGGGITQGQLLAKTLYPTM